MNVRLKRAVDAAAALPEAEQEAIGAMILDEIADEQAWEERFSASQDALGNLVRQARRDVAEAGALTFDPADDRR